MQKKSVLFSVKLTSCILKLFYYIAVFAAVGWCILVALNAPIFPLDIREPVAAVLAILYIAFLAKPKFFFIPSSAAFITVLYLWAQITPTNEGDWQTDVAVLPWVEQNEDTLTFHNVRDFNYRSETDYDVRYSTKQVKISELSSVDLFTSYWSGKDLAHIIVSFGFADKDYIAVSIEARKTKQQAYSTTEGFFRNFHLTYVVAEERDLIALRTVVRQPNEEVYIFRNRFNRPKNTKLLLTYVSKINKLREIPAFYNTLTTNCTTQVLNNAQAGNPLLRYNWRILFSGHTPEYLYQSGTLGNELPLETIVERGYVNPKSKDVSNAERFSANIRQGVPRPAPIAP